MNKTSKIILGIVILLVVAGGAFYCGTLYGKNQATSARSNFGAFRGTRIGASTNGSSFISGSILSKDSSSITLQLPNNGGSKIIFYSGTTQISKMAAGTADDLANGATISVNGTTNSDGSITAQNIQIRPARPAQ